jgi:DivIVA domain-containing protein
MTILSTADIRSVEFTSARKGYDHDEVAAFIDDVCETIADQKDAITALTYDLDSIREGAGEVSAEQESLSARVAELEAALAHAVRELADEKQANTQALENAAGALSRAQHEHKDMKEKLEQAQEYSQVTPSVELLTSAQHTAEMTIARATKLAESMTRESDEYSARTRAEADTYSVAVREQAERDLEDLNNEFDNLKNAQSDYRKQVSSVLRSALEFIEGSLTLDTTPQGSQAKYDEAGEYSESE